MICTCFIDVAFLIEFAFYFHFCVFFNLSTCEISWPRHISGTGVRSNFDPWPKVRTKQEYIPFLVKKKVRGLKCNRVRVHGSKMYLTRQLSMLVGCAIIYITRLSCSPSNVLACFSNFFFGGGISAVICLNGLSRTLSRYKSCGLPPLQHKGMISSSMS